MLPTQKLVSGREVRMAAIQFKMAKIASWHGILLAEYALVAQEKSLAMAKLEKLVSTVSCTTQDTSCETGCATVSWVAVIVVVIAGVCSIVDIYRVLGFSRRHQGMTSSPSCEGRTGKNLFCIFGCF